MFCDAYLRKQGTLMACVIYCSNWRMCSCSIDSTIQWKPGTNVACLNLNLCLTEYQSKRSLWIDSTALNGNFRLVPAYSQKPNNESESQQVFFSPNTIKAFFLVEVITKNKMPGCEQIRKLREMQSQARTSNATSLNTLSEKEELKRRESERVNKKENDQQESKHLGNQSRTRPV